MKEKIINIYGHNFFRYVFVGGMTFLIDFGLLIIFREVCHIPVLIAASISYWISIIFNFTTNMLWTFNIKEKANFKRHIVYYLLLLGFNYLFTIFSIAILVEFNVVYTSAKIVSLVVLVPWTYFMYKKVVFR